MTDDEKQLMWAELLEVIREPSRADYPKPNITVKECSQELQVSRHAAYRRLEKAAQDGRLVRSPEKVLIQGQRCHVYWKA
jgi:hypothetical protein